MLRSEMLGQCGQERVPSIVADWAGSSLSSDS